MPRDEKNTKITGPNSTNNKRTGSRNNSLYSRAAKAKILFKALLLALVFACGLCELVGLSETDEVSLVSMVSTFELCSYAAGLVLVFTNAASFSASASSK